MSNAMAAAPSTPSAPSTPAPSSAPSSAPSPSTPSSGNSPAPSGKAPIGGSSETAPKSGTDQSPGGKSEAAAIKEEIRKHKLKVNGREMELDEPEVLRRAQLAEGADQKFQEAAKARREAAQVLELMKTDPMAVMKQLGMNPREFAEKFLAGELQKEMLTPEQRELQELRDYRAQQQKQQEENLTRTQKQAQQQEFQQMQDRAAKEYDTTITEVLSQSNLPKTAETVKRVAGLLKSALEKGYDLDVPTAVDMVKQGYMGDIQSLLNGLQGEHLVKMLGPELIKAIRKHDLASLKQKLTPQADAVSPTNTISTARPSSEKTTHMRPDEWAAAMRKKAGIE